MSTPEVRTSGEIFLGRFGVVTTGREYAYQFYCRDHRTFDSADVTLPHNIDPKKWPDFVDSQITTSAGCNNHCQKLLISIEPIYVTTEPQRGPRHIIK